MKHFLITIGLAVLVMGSLSAQLTQSWSEGTSAATSQGGLKLESETAKDAKPAMTWSSTSENTGQINQNEPVTITYTFTNTGNAPITITNVKPSCGCTAADYTQEAVAPGETGYVKATYNAKATGFFNKVITVRSNAGVDQLMLQGEVIGGK